MQDQPMITEDILNMVLYGKRSISSSCTFRNCPYDNCTTCVEPPVCLTSRAVLTGKLPYDDMLNSFQQLPSKPLPHGLRIAGISNGWTNLYAVVCGQQPIKSGMRFGPYSGQVIKSEELDSTNDNSCTWEVFSDKGFISHYIDGHHSPDNWMKFVRCAHYAEGQNVNLVQQGNKLYYETTRDIKEGDELLVWYGEGHVTIMGLPVGMKEKNSRMDQTQDSPSFPCDRCGKLFAYDYYRDKHLKYTRCLDRGDRRFPCALCDRSFDKRDRLRIHVLHVHEKYRPHQCHVCAKRFSQSSSLNKHMRVHSGERPYKCPHCDKAFTASSILRTHIRQHSGEKPFKCRHCGRAFASHAAHDSHVRRTHLKNKTWPCEFCGHVFTDAKQLHFHRAAHAQEKSPACEWCHREFPSKFLRDGHQNSFECLVGERVPAIPMT